MLKARCNRCGSNNVEVHLQGTNILPGERYYEYKDGDGSDKFWAIRPTGTFELQIRYGRCGTEGTTIIKRFQTDNAKRDYHIAKVMEKEQKGYVRLK